MSEEWLKEVITNLPNHNFIYRVVCFFVRRKLTYQEMYAILVKLNKGKFGDKAKEMSLKKILSIYKSLHNNQLPKTMTNNDK